MYICLSECPLCCVVFNEIQVLMTIRGKNRKKKLIDKKLAPNGAVLGQINKILIRSELNDKWEVLSFSADSLTGTDQKLIVSLY